MMDMINAPNCLLNYNSSLQIPSTNIDSSPIDNPFPSWKLYENPFYANNSKQKQPFQASKNSTSFRVRPIIMEKEMDIARALIAELKAEIEYERKARKKVETMYKRLAKELDEERKGREALERVCEGLAREISLDKAEIFKMKKEIEEERKMLRMAEVLREERVQMKLAEAKILFEEKLLALERTKQATLVEKPHFSSRRFDRNSQELAAGIDLGRADKTVENLSGKFSRLVLGEKSRDENSGADTLESSRVVLSERSTCNWNVGNFASLDVRRKASPEPENPHIKRGIKGFVEFPRVVRATGGSKHRHWGTKLECQKAQLRILLKQKSPIRSNSSNFIIS